MAVKMAVVERAMVWGLALRSDARRDLDLVDAAMSIRLHEARFHPCLSLHLVLAFYSYLFLHVSYLIVDSM